MNSQDPRAQPPALQILIQICLTLKASFNYCMNFHEGEGEKEGGRERGKEGRKEAGRKEAEREIVLYKDMLLDIFIPLTLFIFLLYINCVAIIGESWACWVFLQHIINYSC